MESTAVPKSVTEKQINSYCLQWKQEEISLSKFPGRGYQNIITVPEFTYDMEFLFSRPPAQ